MVTSRYRTRHSNQFKERVRKGIPDALRGEVWFSLSGGKIYRKNHLSKSKDKKQIYMKN